MKSLPLDLRIWRVTNRLSQQAAADLAGVSLSTYSRWERGLTRPGEDRYETLNYLMAQPPAPWTPVHDGAPE